MLTKKENQVMSILWKNENPMSANQIKSSDDSLSIYTVQQVLQRLLKMEYVKVDNIDRSGTVFARYYAPAISQSKYVQFLLGNEGSFELVSGLISMNKNDKELEELETLIKRQRSSLKG